MPTNYYGRGYPATPIADSFSKLGMAFLQRQQMAQANQAENERYAKQAAYYDAQARAAGLEGDKTQIELDAMRGLNVVPGMDENSLAANYLHLLRLNPAAANDALLGLRSNFGADQSEEAQLRGFRGAGKSLGVNEALTVGRQDQLRAGNFAHETGLEGMRQGGLNQRNAADIRARIGIADADRAASVARWDADRAADGAKPTDLRRLIAERDALPEGHPNRVLYDQMLQKETSRGGGVSFTSPDGTTFSMGGGSADPVIAREGVKKEREADLIWKAADDALGALDQRLLTHGNAVLPGMEQQETGTLYRLVINELRKLTESGALQKADLEYLQTIIQDPTALGAVVQGVGNVMGGNSPTAGTRAQIQQVRDYLAKVRARTGEVYGVGQPSTAPQAQPQPAAAGGPQPGDVAAPADRAAYEALPPGARYRAPDGSIRVKGGASHAGR